MIEKEKYLQIKGLILRKLDAELNPNYFYHSIDHTLDVLQSVILLGKEEGVNADDLCLLKIAALFHDSGFLRTYDGHEEESVRIAQSILTGFGLPIPDLEKIKNLILVTKIDAKPADILEKIMVDADLDYLGREDFPLISQKLFMEWKGLKKVENLQEFYKLQFDFLEKHKFQTKTALKLRCKTKKNHLKKMKELLLLGN
jgi:predicted metal-dependent HD superfamily phosphohydrolase